MSRSTNYGLKKRPDYDEMLDYLNNKQPKLKFPDRLATFIRRTNQISNLLDGEGYSLFDLEMQQQKNMAKSIAKETMLFKMGVPPTAQQAPAQQAPLLPATPLLPPPAQPASSSTSPLLPPPAQPASSSMGVLPLGSAVESYRLDAGEPSIGKVIDKGTADEDAQKIAQAEKTKKELLEQIHQNVLATHLLLPSREDDPEASPGGLSMAAATFLPVTPGGLSEAAATFLPVTPESSPSGAAASSSAAPRGAATEFAFSWPVTRKKEEVIIGVEWWPGYKEDEPYWSGEEDFWDTPAYQSGNILATSGSPAIVSQDNPRNIIVRNLVISLIKQTHGSILNKEQKEKVIENVKDLKNKNISGDQRKILINNLYDIYGQIHPKIKIR